MQNVSALIKFDKVGVVFGDDVALRNASFAVQKGEFVCLVGQSGSGKSTVLKLIAGLESPSSGKVSRPENIAMVFQNGALLPWLTVVENIALGLSAKVPPHAAERTCRTYIEMTGLQKFIDKYPRELSGGQRQRVGIARALAAEPSVLLLDEPFSALDIATTDELHRDLIAIWEKTGQTIVMVSHSIEEAVTLASRVLLVKDHTIAQSFDITLARPRREQEGGFEHEVMRIRREFLSPAKPARKN